jgi:hypothetical protein
VEIKTGLRFRAAAFIAGAVLTAINLAQLVLGLMKYCFVWFALRKIVRQLAFTENQCVAAAAAASKTNCHVSTS